MSLLANSLKVVIWDLNDTLWLNSYLEPMSQPA